jgi:ring-1,2-phenylacetyl-CoA epoxidase subunit PaaD
MVKTQHTKEEIFNFLSSIPDPEIPVVSIKEIGMLRDVILTDKGYEIILTPTYTGCPAMGIIEEDILKVLNDKGVTPVKVKLVYSPAWTTDWMNDEAREKMRKYGIAPPMKSTCNKWAESGISEMIKCPHCNSMHTSLISQFGSTACKALYKCNDCKEPFEYFKCH